MKPHQWFTETLKRETLGKLSFYLKSRISMKYDITKTTAPTMPTLGKGTECFKLLLSQTSFDMHEPLLPMLSPVLGAKISNAEFQYPSGQWLEMCGQQAARTSATTICRRKNHHNFHREIKWHHCLAKCF